MTEKTYPSAWTKHVFNYEAPHDVDTLTETVRAVFDEFEQGYPIDFYEVLIRSFIPNPYHLAAVLRSCGFAQVEHPGWQEALEWCYYILGPELSEDALFGMMETLDKEKLNAAILRNRNKLQGS